MNIYWISSHRKDKMQGVRGYQWIPRSNGSGSTRGRNEYLKEHILRLLEEAEETCCFNQELCRLDSVLASSGHLTPPTP